MSNYKLLQRIRRKNKYIYWSRILGGLNSTGFRGYLNRQDGTVTMCRFSFNPRSDKKKRQCIAGVLRLDMWLLIGGCCFSSLVGDAVVDWPLIKDGCWLVKWSGMRSLIGRWSRMVADWAGGQGWELLIGPMVRDESCWLVKWPGMRVADWSSGQGWDLLIGQVVRDKSCWLVKW